MFKKLHCWHTIRLDGLTGLAIQELCCFCNTDRYQYKPANTENHGPFFPKSQYMQQRDLVNEPCEKRNG